MIRFSKSVIAFLALTTFSQSVFSSSIFLVKNGALLGEFTGDVDTMRIVSDGATNVNSPIFNRLALQGSRLVKYDGEELFIGNKGDRVSYNRALAKTFRKVLNYTDSHYHKRASQVVNDSDLKKKPYSHEVESVVIISLIDSPEERFIKFTPFDNIPESVEPSLAAVNQASWRELTDDFKYLTSTDIYIAVTPNVMKSGDIESFQGGLALEKAKSYDFWRTWNLNKRDLADFQVDAHYAKTLEKSGKVALLELARKFQDSYIKYYSNQITEQQAQEFKDEFIELYKSELQKHRNNGLSSYARAVARITAWTALGAGVSVGIVSAEASITPLLPFGVFAAAVLGLPPALGAIKLVDTVKKTKKNILEAKRKGMSKVREAIIHNYAFSGTKSSLVVERGEFLKVIGSENTFGMFKEGGGLEEAKRAGLGLVKIRLYAKGSSQEEGLSALKEKVLETTRELEENFGMHVPMIGGLKFGSGTSSDDINKLISTSVQVINTNTLGRKWNDLKANQDFEGAFILESAVSQLAQDESPRFISTQAVSLDKVLDELESHEGILDNRVMLSSSEEATKRIKQLFQPILTGVEAGLKSYTKIVE